MQRSGADITIEIAGASDTGVRRSNNEDAVWWRHDASAGGVQSAVLVVADGMGGAAAGEVASHTAVEECVRVLPPDLVATDVAAGLRAAAEGANAAVHRMSAEQARYEGMGSTLSIAAIVGPQLWVAHVGDSRCYLVRGGEAQQVTVDHTWVAEEVQQGRLDADEAAAHPARNVINRAIGIEEQVDVDVFGPLELASGDIVVVCSDGLSDVVSDSEIAQIASASTPSRAVEDLIRLANERGGPDNVSVVAARVAIGPGAPSYGSVPRERPRAVTGGGTLLPGKSLRIALWAGIALLLALLGTFGILLATGGGSEKQGPVLVATPTEESTSSPTAASTPRRSPQRASATPGETDEAQPKCDDGTTPARLYIVRENDTLSDIKSAFNLEDPLEIVDCDPQLETVDDIIRIGQEIAVPCVDGTCPDAEEP